jgi:N-acetylglutamate synthase-like GNAT family acetyltransferase
MNATDREKMLPNVKIRSGLKAGDIGYVIYLHGTLYALEQGWDCSFEAYVAGPLAEFVKAPGERQQIWLVESDGQVAGSIAIVEASADQAQLRWLLLHPKLRGQGIGKKLMEEVIRFSREKHYRSIFLWTVSAMTTAINLYKNFGFQLTEEKPQELWGAQVIEQRYELIL